MSTENKSGQGLRRRTSPIEAKYSQKLENIRGLSPAEIEAAIRRRSKSTAAVRKRIKKMAASLGDGSLNYRKSINAARSGLPVSFAIELMETWAIPVKQFALILGCSERKWSRLRKDQAGTSLGPVESDRLLRLNSVLEQAKSVFDSERDAVLWFHSSLPALSGDAPVSIMDTDIGVHHVDGILSRLEYGVYS